MVASDRTQELKNFEYEETLFRLEKSLDLYVKKEDNEIDMREKVSLSKLDELMESLNNLRTINATQDENQSQKLTTLREDFESKTKEMIENIDDLKQQMAELDEEGDSYDDESELDQSELEDTLDVNDMNRTALEKDKDKDRTSEELSQPTNSASQPHKGTTSGSSERDTSHINIRAASGGDLQSS